MSTRCTIAYNDDFHLYEECFDKNNVYLRLEDGDWAASLNTATIDWDDGGSDRPTLHVKMNIDLWRKIVDGWVASHWGQHPEYDHKKPEIRPDALEWLEGLSKKREVTEGKKEND